MIDAKTKLPDFHAVIFANGEDDDLPGISAAFRNEPVYFLDRLHAPGAPVMVSYKQIRLSSYVAFEDDRGNTLAVMGDGVGAPHVIRLPGPGPKRPVMFSHCTIIVGAERGGP